MPEPELRVRDTLTGQIVPLRPQNGGKVGIYACGPTVYGRIHIGNARPFVLFSLYKRFLEELGHEVSLVINVTDINDKIYVAAAEQGTGSEQWAREMTAAYIEDTGALGLGRPDAEPLASETIAEIVDLIEALIERGHAYESGGDVYFRVRSFSDYGKLSNRNPDDMDQGEETGTASLKEDPLDFALWKATKEGEDSSWGSPWGPGRPGWHIECSAMAEKILGLDFAIHGGGLDLVFPHHENEIAQTEAGRGAPLAQVWMHNGMVLTGPAEKMSKSEGNVFLLHEALARFGPEAVVDFLISGHYGQPLSFDEGALEQAQARNERVRDFFRDAEEVDVAAPDAVVVAAREDFLAALADDFNTPRAMAEVFDLITEGNKRPLAGAHDAVRWMLRILGLESLADVAVEADAAAQALLAERERARAERDFERADQLRDQLGERGFEIRDTPNGAKLVRRA